MDPPGRTCRNGAREVVGSGGRASGGPMMVTAVERAGLNMVHSMWAITGAWGRQEGA